MASTKAQGAELEGDITFISTPAAQPSKFATGEDCGVKITNVSIDPSARPLNVAARGQSMLLPSIGLDRRAAICQPQS